MNILFLCTHNRCRSILAEAALNHLAAPAIRGYSAGSQPAGAVHPLTLAMLQRRGLPTEGLYSKSWDEMAGLSPDIVITVCDQAAGGACPLFFSDALKAHWGVADPSQAQGSETDVDAACNKTLDLFLRRLERLVAAIQARPDNTALQALLQDLEQY